MSVARKKTWLALLPAIAALLGAVGLVASAGRAPSRPRSVSGFRVASSAASVALVPPVVLAPLAVAPEPERRAEENAAGALPVALRLAGRVSRPDGEPAAGACVLLGPARATCGPDGAFELLAADELGAADLVVFEPGYEPVLWPAFGSGLGPGSSSDLRFVLGPPSGSLSGTVVDRAGRPLAGWSVGLDGIDPLETFDLRAPVRTDPAGRFRIDDVPRGVHVVRAWRERRELASRSAPAAVGSEGLAIVVESFE
jgi:hypothetical protein